MTHRIFTVLVVGFLVWAVPVAVLAGAAPTMRSVDLPPADPGWHSDSADMDVSGPIETGAVPEVKSGDPANEPYSSLDSHYNPFSPDTREIDEGGGGN